MLEQDLDWVAPLLWRSAFCNILTGYLRRKTLTLAQACKLQGEAEDLPMGSQSVVDSGTVLELVRDSGCSAYDCEFAALAKTLQVKLLKASPMHAVPLTAV